jgi:integrase/recombinase XerD
VVLNRFHQTMTRSGIHALVKRRAIRAAANAPSLAGKNVHPHVIRHTTASLLLQAGVDINTIRGWLGHVSLETTNIYAEINLQTKARALATCEVEGSAKGQKQWRDQPDLLTFLRTL